MIFQQDVHGVLPTPDREWEFVVEYHEATNSEHIGELFLIVRI